MHLAVVFDAYGTLLDVNGAMRLHAAMLPPDWERISAEWRAKQLEYTWIETLTAAGPHRDFWAVTEAALDYVSARHHLTDPAVRAALLDAYRVLPAYDDAIPALRALRAGGIRTAILSNGAPKMLESAIDAAGLRDLLDAVVSVEEAGVYKPDPRVYRLAESALGCPIASMGFVSSNAWDAQGAVAAGFTVAWCNRAGNPVEYGLDRSARIVGDLTGLEAALAGRSNQPE